MTDKPKEPNESDSFWKTVEDKLNCAIPKVLKNVLESYGYNSLPALRRFNSSKIDSIEKFMQEKCYRVIDDSELKDHYGKFWKAPELYELGGFRGVLEELADKFKIDAQRSSTLSKDPTTAATQEPKSDTDLLLNEQNHLYEMLKTYIDENFPEVFETDDVDVGDDDQEQAQANELIVKVTKNGFGQFVATVQCPSCKKSLNGSKTAKRWKHNVYRHIKDHHSKPKDKSNQKTICESFNETLKKSVTDRDCSRSPFSVKRRRTNSVNSELIISEDDEQGKSQEMDGGTNKSLPNKSTENNRAPTNNSVNGDKEQTQSPTGSERERNVETEENLEGSPNTLTDKEKANWSPFQQYNFLNNEGSLSAAAPSTCERRHIQLTESKWMKEWYSRSARIKRQLLDSGSLNVSKITDYFKIINENDMLKLEVLMLKKRLLTFMSQPEDKPTQRLFISNFLQLLLTTAEANANRKAQGKRYCQELKDVCTYIFILGGLMLYEFLVLNLPIPSVTTVRDTLSSKSTLEEGAFRFKELDAFLTLHNLPRKISVSEDGTRVQGRIQYHRKTNQIVGFPLRLDANGCPIVGSYPATSSTIIGKYFSENTASKNAYCIMVQPLAENAPSFCLALFGTNNKFSHKDIKNRWKWMRSEAKKYNVEIVNYSSDGDAKLLKAMMMNVFTEPNSWFSADVNTPVLHIQDHIHIGTKLKSRLLNPSVIIPMGNFIASRGHLVDLVKNCSKDQTFGLKESHLNPKDKMNYRSVELMTNPKLISFMLSKFPGAKATATYLNMSREVVYAFTQKDLSHSERIKLIWKWVFFLRIWREYIQNYFDYSVSNNFITLNSYYCIELNAHAMVHMMRMFRDTEEPHLFLPWLTGSQPCEASFRSFRSMTSTHSTVVNFSVLDLVYRVRRVDFSTEAKCKLQKNFAFPHSKRTAEVPTASVSTIQPLPEDIDIEFIIDSAQKEAFQLAKDLGMIPKGTKFKIPPMRMPRYNDKCTDEDFEDDDGEEQVEIDPENVEDEDDVEEEEVFHDCEDCDITEDLLVVSSGTLNTKTLSDVVVTPTSPFVKVFDGDKNVKIIFKSTLCWLLSSGDYSLSSDRLVRVQGEGVIHSCNFSHQFHSPSVETEVTIGDWCAFRAEDQKSVVIGHVLSFSYSTGSSKKNQEYSRLRAPTIAPDKNARGIECLCSWYSLSKKRLQPISMDTHGYYNLDKYICTLPRPKISDKGAVVTYTLQQISNAK